MDCIHFAQWPTELEDAFILQGTSPQGLQGTVPRPKTLVGSPTVGNGLGHELCLSVSTTLHPHARIDSLNCDLILLSSDRVFFHVNQQRILSVSDNGFNSLLFGLSPPRTDVTISVIPLPDPADVVNIRLHAIYNIDCTHFSAPFEASAAAARACTTYGLPLQQHAVPPRPFAVLVLAHTRAHPIAAYALADAHELEPLAIAVSLHLLAFALAAQIGSRYLLRLFALHCSRMDELCRLLLQPPRAHALSWTCCAEQQRALVSAQLVWDSGTQDRVSADRVLATGVC
ncbi:hypothetical protein OBBRIDRAFT_783392 [Obba rivulosa]|uniref:BTB domain-containing protein n=1 Tax=Obba rivulosa TaxID=1052685 RepID=A0A8E2AKP0_9APHY|nr:hypothetical protein OBBRIDRAFT_783392 [Obba rivulosa]